MSGREKEWMNETHLVRVAALHGVVSEHQCARFHLLRVLHRQLRKNGVHRRRCEVRHHHRTVRVPVLSDNPVPVPVSPPLRLPSANQPGWTRHRWEDGRHASLTGLLL
jgi:hypothetical protein